MKKLSFILATAASASFFIACGSSSTDSKDQVIDTVKTVDELSACTNSREGDSVLVTSQSAVYVCNDGKWEKSYASTPVVETSSSSAKVASNSSIAMSSSSVAVSFDTMMDSRFGVMMDSRDGQFYKTVQIGEQVWMAENLNYFYNEGTAESYCYRNEPDSCDKYGRFYTWSAAMDSAALFSDGGEGCGYKVTCNPSGTVRGVCPEGWHLPSEDEFKTLISAVGGWDVAGRSLKSRMRWQGTGNGTDEYGFSALPAGDCEEGICGYSGSMTAFWYASERDSSYALGMRLYNDAAYVFMRNIRKDSGFSVRCLRDSRL